MVVVTPPSIVAVLERGWQLKMFEFREKHALEGAIRRLRKNSTTEGMAPFDMFNDVQDHVLRTAQTHIDRVVLEAFVAARRDPERRHPENEGQGVKEDALDEARQRVVGVKYPRLAVAHARAEVEQRVVEQRTVALFHAIEGLDEIGP